MLEPHPWSASICSRIKAGSFSLTLPFLPPDHRCAPHWDILHQNLKQLCIPVSLLEGSSIRWCKRELGKDLGWAAFTSPRSPYTAPFLTGLHMFQVYFGSEMVPWGLSHKACHYLMLFRSSGIWKKKGIKEKKKEKDNPRALWWPRMWF